MHCPQNTDVNHTNNVSIGERNAGGRLSGPASKVLLLLATCGEDKPTVSAVKFATLPKGKAGIADICSSSIAAAAAGDDTEDNTADAAQDATLLRHLDYAFSAWTASPASTAAA